ncbi:hypothetical protein BGZ58_009728 [Dissophora ornata]|nr:hypothetical protein BGZ58_009728 [Dissophora ornata]
MDDKSSKPSDDEQHYGSKLVADGEPRYLMYIPYAGVTNQLISIWHGSLIAKSLNRTLLIPNLSPNVHVETGGSSNGNMEPAPTKWSEFFDLEHYSEQTGLKIQELDEFLKRRGIVEKSSVPEEVTRQMRLSKKRSSSGHKKRSGNKEEQGKDSEANTAGGSTRRKIMKKRWIQLGSPIVATSPSSPSTPSSDSESLANEPFLSSTLPRVVRSVKFPAVQKCFSEAGYGTDRRIDMTGRRFMQRYNIDPTLIPTPFLDPEEDNKTIWSRWRMDKVVERYQQPEYEQQEILCLGHVYRLLPGGINRAWVEFGQHFRYTDEVHGFVDEILEQLLPSSTSTNEGHEGVESIQEKEESQGIDMPSSSSRRHQSFIGVHLRRGDFQRHCLGITSPADPNGWNRCYPSTEHIISLLDTKVQDILHSQPTLPSSSGSMFPAVSSSPGPAYINPALTKRASQKNKKNPPVLVLTNEHDPEELAKADAQNWIRVDHDKLGTLARFGRYGPILIDGALLARANLLVGVEYSTYFKTASKRAETWFGGRTLLVT